MAHDVTTVSNRGPLRSSDGSRYLPFNKKCDGVEDCSLTILDTFQTTRMNATAVSP